MWQLYIIYFVKNLFYTSKLSRTRDNNQLIDLKHELSNHL